MRFLCLRGHLLSMEEENVKEDRMRVKEMMCAHDGLPEYRDSLHGVLMVW